LHGIVYFLYNVVLNSKKNFKKLKKKKSTMFVLRWILLLFYTSNLIIDTKIRQL